MSEEFYIGYQPRAPRGLSGFLRRVVSCVALTVLAVATVLVLGQGRFDSSRFAYLDYRPYQGTLRLEPYPRLGEYWLVAPGKHGLDIGNLGADYDSVRLQGALIQNGANRMLEVLPGSISSQTPAMPESTPDSELGLVALTGEIVDTKCYFGAMNPGHGKVHRACAARCLLGGIPAGLLVRDVNGEARVVILASASGRAISGELAPFAGERVTMRGAIFRSRGSLILRLTPGRLVRE